MLFSERYKDFIELENREPVDHICGKIDYPVKKQLSAVMSEFAEPMTVYLSRYYSREKSTTALEIAVETFNATNRTHFISFQHNISDDSVQDSLASAFTPFLFDIIELQYKNLSDEEKVNFQSAINLIFGKNDIPWLLHNGRMIKIDSTQFEQDLKQKASALMQELVDAEPIFQSAYNELIKAIEFFQKGDYAEAISNAEKSYESVLKVVLNTDKGNADKLTKELVDGRLSLPDSMSGAGFKEKVLMSLPFIRNNSSASHGAGKGVIEITKALANLSINLAATLNTYLIDVFSKHI